MDDPTARTIRLPDGRRLGFAEWGAPDGLPLFHFHGWPGSRLEAGIADPQARAAGIRIIAPDRPGYGWSDFQPGRTLLDWPEDVARLADALEIGRFSVVGASGGAPYAAACAYAIPERLDRIALLCGLGPAHEPGSSKGMTRLNRYGLALARRSPGLVHGLLRAAAPWIRAHAERFVAHLATTVSPVDREVLARDELRRLFAATFREAFRHGAAGAARDVALYARPWPFELSQVKPEIHLWHGEADRVVPSSMGRRYQRELPRCCAVFLPDEGHFSLLVHHLPRMFDVMLAPDGGGPDLERPVSTG